MPTRNVVLTDHHETMISDLVEAGRYQNASEVLRDGLRLIEQREAADAAKLEMLRQAAQVGSDAIARGEYVQFASGDELEAYLNQIADLVIAKSKAG
jgi:antitoxin ParD1/3/4